LEFHRSTIETEWMLADKGIPHGYLQRGGDQFIAKVRSKLATEFLRDYPMATDLFFLDDDIGWPAAKVVEFIERPEDVLAGVYPKKSDARDFPVELSVDPVSGLLIERDGLVKANGVPTGFMRIKRHVLERLAEKAPLFRDLELDGSTKEYHGIFQSGIGPDGWWWGEDYSFCRNVTDLGCEIWVDPAIEFTHRGNKKWTDTLADHMGVFRDRAFAAAAALTKEVA
jgi:hypothetical protein